MKLMFLSLVLYNVLWFDICHLSWNIKGNLQSILSLSKTIRDCVITPKGNGKHLLFKCYLVHLYDGCSCHFCTSALLPYYVQFSTPWENDRKWLWPRMMRIFTGGWNYGNPTGSIRAETVPPPITKTVIV